MRFHKESVMNGLSKRLTKPRETDDFVVSEKKQGPDVTADKARENERPRTLPERKTHGASVSERAKEFF